MATVNSAEKAARDRATTPAPKRTGYHEVLRVLFTDATRRVTSAQEPNFYEVDHVPARVERLRAEYDRNHRRNEAILRQLKAQGLKIEVDGRTTCTVRVDYPVSRSRQLKWREAKELRLATITRLRAQALIELVDLPRAEAKRYLQRLQAQLAKV